MVIHESVESCGCDLRQVKFVFPNYQCLFVRFAELLNRPSHLLGCVNLVECSLSFVFVVCTMIVVVPLASS